VGALLLVQRDRRLRDQMVDAIAPVWDGNETWLIMAGVTLLAAFPLAYGILLPALYLPRVVMLLSLGCAESPSSSGTRARSTDGGRTRCSRLGRSWRRPRKV